MNSDELRALAGKLRKLQAGEAYEAADYLRACADAQPVAWLYRDWANVLKVSQLDPHEDGAFAVFAEPQPQADAQPVPAVPTGWQLVPVEPTPEMLQAGASIMDFDRSGWYDADVSRAEYRAMLAAAPTVPQAEPIDPHMIAAEDRFPDAPQAEPCIGNDSACPCQDGDACHYKDAADGTKAWPVPQAEPKREPLSDERITKGEYVLATKFSDGDPGDHWGVGFYDRLENGRHYIVDRAGQQIRGGGFRRAGRITVEVGIWLLSAAKSLEASPPGTVNLWTMLTERAHGIGGSDAE